jgi:hypothetical protein
MSKITVSYVQDNAVKSKTVQSFVDEAGLVILEANVKKIGSEENHVKFEQDLKNSKFCLTKAGKSLALGVAFNGKKIFETSDFCLYEGYDKVTNRYDLKLKTKTKQIDLVTIACEAGKAKVKVSEKQEEVLKLMTPAESAAVLHYMFLLKETKKAENKAEKESEPVVTVVTLDSIPEELADL